MKKKIFSCLILFGVSFLNSSKGQNALNRELNPLLQNKNNFKDYWNTICDFYFQKNYPQDPKLFSEFKKWNRWAWWQSRHLDSTGNMTNHDEENYKTLLASRETGGLFQRKTSEHIITNTNTGNWNFIGPYNVAEGIARVDRIAFHATDPNILYCGTPAGGLWKTNDRGNNWFPLGGFLPQVGVSGIVVDYSNPNVIYALTGEFATSTGTSYSRNCIGVLKSINGGITWQLLNKVTTNNGSFDGNGFKLLQMPNNPNKLFASTSTGLFYTEDGGQNWAKFQTPSYLNDMIIKPGTNGKYIFGCGDNTYMHGSSDYGASFYTFSISDKNNFLRNFKGNIKLAASNNLPNRFFLEASGYSKPLPGDTLVFINKIFITDDNFQNLTSITNPGPPDNGIAPGVFRPYYAAIAVSNIDANIFLSGNTSLVRSTTGGASFGPLIQQGIHSDFHEIVSNPLNNFMYACTDGGVYESIDQGANWIYKGNGIGATQFYHMSATDLNDAVTIAGAQDNGYIRTDGAGNSFLAGGGDGFSGKFLNNNQNTFVFCTNSSMYKYDISTKNQTHLYTPFIADHSNFFPAIEVHPTNNNIIYAGYPTGLRRSFNGGVTWDSIMGLSASAGFNLSGGIAVSPQNPDRLYIASNDILKVSSDKGTTQTTISGNPGWPNITDSTIHPITDVTTRSNQANEVWVTFGSSTGTKVLYSANAGATWTDFTGSLPQLPVYCVKYTSDGDVYIGTDAGVYFMDISMNDWFFFSNGLPMVPVSDLYINETAGTIKASTFGRGNWQSTLYSNCVTALTLTDTISGRYFYQSSGTIATSQYISGSYGNDTRYRAEQKITLKSGFKVLTNSYLHAIIGPCGQGIMSRNINSAVGDVISKIDFLKSLLKN